MKSFLNFIVGLFSKKDKGQNNESSVTNVVEKDGKQLVKIVAWYDNEVGYTAQMIRTMKLFL